MYLVDTESLQLKECSSNDQIEYAILSHRWEDEELSFKELLAGVNLNTKGFAKVQRFCQEAARAGIRHAWIDTCCIDKSSSAELSEAINSMYRWYQQAKMCYVYLSDVNSVADLSTSEWFSRGWTLQELLAPRNVKFYNRFWVPFGTKHGLQASLSAITGVPTRILRGDDLNLCSIAQRMSWASSRVTTRPEDIAYCLMGLFDVSMPLLYGEGSKAFVRLQEEVIKASNDHSIFAWSAGGGSQPRGLLASSPASFKDFGHVRSVEGLTSPEQYSMTNVGLSITFQMTPWTLNTYLAILECQDLSSENELMPFARKPPETLRLGIFLRRMHSDWQFARTSVDGHDIRVVDIAEAGVWWKTSRVLVAQRSLTTPFIKWKYGFVFRQMSLPLFPLSADDEGVISRLPVVPVRPRRDLTGSTSSHVDGSGGRIRPNWLAQLGHGQHGTVVTFRVPKAPIQVQAEPLGHELIELMSFGFDFDFNPVCVLWNHKASHFIDGFLLKNNMSSLSDELAKLVSSNVEQSWDNHGIVALRGSRKSGLFCCVEALNLDIRITEGRLDDDFRAWFVDVSLVRSPYDLSGRHIPFWQTVGTFTEHSTRFEDLTNQLNMIEETLDQIERSIDELEARLQSEPDPSSKSSIRREIQLLSHELREKKSSWLQNASSIIELWDSLGRVYDEVAILRQFWSLRARSGWQA